MEPQHGWYWRYMADFTCVTDEGARVPWMVYQNEIWYWRRSEDRWYKEDRFVQEAYEQWAAREVLR